MNVGTDTFRHAPGCAHADWSEGGGEAEDAEGATASERDALRCLSLGHTSEGRHTDVYRCRECAAKGPLD
jgi:hypothetical protein